MSPDVAWLEIYNYQTQRYFYVNQETGEWSKNPPNDQITKIDPDSVWSIWNDDAQMTLYYHSRTNQWTSHLPSTSSPVVSLSAFAKKPSLRRYISLPTPNHQQRLRSRPSEPSIYHHYYTCQQYQLDGNTTFVDKTEQLPLPTIDSRKITDVSPKVKKQGSLLEMSKASLESTFRSKIFPQSFKKQPMKSSLNRCGPPLTVDLEGTSTPHMQCCPCTSPKSPSPRISSPPFSPLSPTPPPLSPTSLSSPQSVTSPQTPQGHFDRHSFDHYAKTHFTIHKRGLLVRHTVPLDEMSQWIKKSINKPLLLSTDKKLASDALDCFKKIQVIMGDRSRVYHGRSCSCDDVQDIQSIIMCGITQGQHIRDEIYVQLCKQLNHNPSSTSTQKGWELLSAFFLAIPPSNDLAPYLIQFMHDHLPTKSIHGGDTDSLASYFDLKLKEICERGPRENIPSRAEIQLARISVYHKQQQQQKQKHQQQDKLDDDDDDTSDKSTLGTLLFGTTLTTLMEHQQPHTGILPSNKSLKIPSILPWLVDAIRQLQGHSTQGIFRIPGLADQITLLRTQLEHEYSTTGYLDNMDLASCCTDPNVPASLLRVWLRELPTSLIPEEYYDRCISADLEGAMDIIDCLPDVHQRALLFIIGFLQEFLLPEVCCHTLMTVDNLAMIFAPNLLRSMATNDLVLVLQRSRYEQLFVKTLILGPKVDMDQQLYG